MNWDIKGCSGKCIKCNKNFDDGEIFQCRLFLEQEGPRREDYCKDCWRASVEPLKGYSSWQGRYKLQPVEINDASVSEPILKQLLKKWLNSSEKLHQSFCYILAILLERDKTFQERPKVAGPDGRKQLIYEDRDTGETYILSDPGLTLKELKDIEGQLQEMLKQELKPNTPQTANQNTEKKEC